MIKCQCPMCKEFFEAESEWLGQQAQCPTCNELIEIPRPPEKEYIGKPILSSTIFEQEKTKKALITHRLTIAAVVFSVMLALGTGWYFLFDHTTPHFLMEKIVGIRLGKKAKSACSDEEDYFHCFKIDYQYHEKILYEYAKMQKSEAKKSGCWNSKNSNTLILSSPVVRVNKNNEIVLLVVELTNKELIRDVISDFADKGFHQGTAFFKNRKINITDLLTAPTENKDCYTFLSNNNKYQLTIWNNITHKRICSPQAFVTTTSFSLAKHVERNEEKNGGYENGFCYDDSDHALVTHAYAHDNGAKNCIHINGFEKH